MTHIPSAPRVAIACQGGGSHTAFTAGVLQSLLRHEQNGAFEIAALTGTSGGAICAMLAWYGLIKQRSQGWDVARTTALLDAFWTDNAAQSPAEEGLNAWLISLYQLQGRGLIPDVKVSPYGIQATAAVETLKAFFPRPQFLDLELLLKKHVDLSSVPQPIDSPRLLVGAVNVRDGTFKAFDSSKAEISLDSVRASATLPLLSQAVRIGEDIYWDGLFSQNPPIRDLWQGIEIARKPQEIWIVRINPQYQEKHPMTVEEIEDRRNELAGNLSLGQEIQFLELVNRWLRMGKMQVEGIMPIDIHWIEMDAARAAELNYASKLDRSAHFITGLMADGIAQAEAFVERRFGG